MLDQQMDEYEVMDRAIRANVTISTLNARGLYTMIPAVTGANLAAISTA